MKDTDIQIPPIKLTPEQLLEKADAAELYNLFQKKSKECEKAGEALLTIAKHYMDNTGTPRYAPPSEDAIGAMERVALAAIELGKTVASKLDK